MTAIIDDVQAQITKLEAATLQAMKHNRDIHNTKHQHKQEFAKKVFGTEYQIKDSQKTPFCAVPKLHFYFDMTGVTPLTGRDNELVNMAISNLIQRGLLIEVRPKLKGDRLIALAESA